MINNKEHVRFQDKHLYLCSHTSFSLIMVILHKPLLQQEIVVIELFSSQAQLSICISNC